MSQKAVYEGFSSGEVENFVLKDQNPEYLGERKKAECCSEWFDERLDKLVDEDRFIPDKAAVASTAMRIGICILESSERDAMDMVHQTWLETGKEEKLKNELLESLGSEIQRYDLENNLGVLETEEVLELFRKVRGVWNPENTET